MGYFSRSWFLLALVLATTGAACEPAALARSASKGGPGRVGQGAELPRYQFTQPHMGTQFRIVLYAADEATATKAAAAAFARIKHLDDVMSDYRHTSELMQLCQQA